MTKTTKPEQDKLGLERPAPVTRQRMLLGVGVLTLIFVLFIGQLVRLGFDHKDHLSHHIIDASGLTTTSRPEILDRNGLTLATDVMIASVYANPNDITNVDETVESLVAILPDLDEKQLRQRLMSKRDFIWVKREVSPHQQRLVHRAGLGGIYFRRETKRVYPSGRIPSHIIGFVNIDNEGISGLERYIDQQGLRKLQLAGLANKTHLTPVSLTLDLRVQHAVRDELIDAMARYQTISAAGMVMDAETGEIIALVSLPDFDPLRPKEALTKTRINRMTKGSFELGSVMKAFTIAAALDHGSSLRTTVYNAKGKFRHDGIEISDYRGKDRNLSLDEVFIYSSNIGAARIGLALGAKALQAFYQKLGMFDDIALEIPERGHTRLPPSWRDSSLMTISYGHGIALTPLHALRTFATLVNGGYRVSPTLIRLTNPPRSSHPVLKPETSQALRELLRLNVIQGTARGANREPGYLIGGKTGTANKLIDGAYAEGVTMNSFMGAFPMDKPRYVFYVMLDEPKPEHAHNPFTTAGHNAVPTASRIVSRIAPFLGIAPHQGEALPLSFHTVHGNDRSALNTNNPAAMNANQQIQ